MTTSASSANRTALPDRRSFLSAAGAVGALGLSALPALAAGGDEQLFELGRRLAQLAVQADEADRRLSAVGANYDQVMPDKRPEALFVRDDDDLELRSYPAMPRNQMLGRRVYGPVDIEAAAFAIEGLQDHELPGGDKPEVQRKLARLREIVDAYAANRDARRSAWIACGMADAEEAATAAHDRHTEVLFEIAQCPATTSAGFRLKVRLALHCFGDTPQEVEERITDVLDDRDTCGESLALSILRDLAKQVGATGGFDA